MKEINTIQVIEDTLDGAVEREVNLEDLSIPQLRNLISLMPSLGQYLQKRIQMDEAGIVAFGLEGEPVYRINKDEIVSLFCVIDSGIDKQVAILSVSEMGMLIRTDGDWLPISKADPQMEEYCLNPKYRMFQIDWDKEPVAAGGLDPADENAWEHQLVQVFDSGAHVGSSLMPKYAFEVDPEQLFDW